MKKISELTTDELIKLLKSKIERLAPPDIERKKGRDGFYKVLTNVSKESQIEWLNRIHLIVAFGKADEKELKSKERNDNYRISLRKKSEYSRRVTKKGKRPKGEPPHPMEFHHYPKYRPKGSSKIFPPNSFLWGLYKSLKESELSRIYNPQVHDPIKDILRKFSSKNLRRSNIDANIYTQMRAILYNFCGTKWVLWDNIRRMLYRMKKDSHIKELDEFEERSEKSSHNSTYNLTTT